MPWSKGSGSCGALKGAQQLLRQAPGIDVLLVGHEGRRVPPRKIGQTLLVSLGSGGSEAVILNLDRNGRGQLRYSQRYLRLQGAGEGRSSR